VTVAELIEKLKQYPQDAEVLDTDREGMGCFTDVSVCEGYVKEQTRWGVHRTRLC